jgi:hypothetical protein
MHKLEAFMALLHIKGIDKICLQAERCGLTITNSSFDKDKNIVHLFVNCKYVDTIWHLMVNCQLHYASGNNVQNIINSHPLDKKAFLFCLVQFFS